MPAANVRVALFRIPPVACPPDSEKQQRGTDNSAVCFLQLWANRRTYVQVVPCLLDKVERAAYNVIAKSGWNTWSLNCESFSPPATDPRRTVLESGHRRYDRQPILHAGGMCPFPGWLLIPRIISRI
jgi:hypothetical protein